MTLSDLQALVRYHNLLSSNIPENAALVRYSAVTHE